jgi:hypothetical protein
MVANSTPRRSRRCFNEPAARGAPTDMSNTMKLDFITSRALRFLPRVLLPAVFALLSGHVFAEDLNASYTTGAEVPVRSDSFDASGKNVRLALNFAPAASQDLMLVRNTGSGFIRGKFSNVSQGQIVTLHYGGVPYQFVANYYGGSGRDLVLMRIDLTDVGPAAVKKLDDTLLLALKKSRGQTPFDRAKSLRPEDYEHAGRVLVDVQGSIKNEVANEIRQAGAEVVAERQTSTTARVWVPLSELEAVANIRGITAMTAARPSATRHFVPSQKSGTTYNQLSK